YRDDVGRPLKRCENLPDDQQYHDHQHGIGRPAATSRSGDHQPGYPDDHRVKARQYDNDKSSLGTIHGFPLRKILAFRETRLSGRPPESTARSISFTTGAVDSGDMVVLTTSRKTQPMRGSWLRLRV